MRISHRSSDTLDPETGRSLAVFISVLIGLIIIFALVGQIFQVRGPSVSPVPDSLDSSGSIESDPKAEAEVIAPDAWLLSTGSDVISEDSIFETAWPEDDFKVAVRIIDGRYIPLNVALQLQDPPPSNKQAE
jgi:hypothetical protein